MVLPSSGAPCRPDRRGTLLTPRSVLIVALSGLVAYGGVPALLPTIATSTLSQALAFVILLVALDQIVP